jgi:hypothetical protein
MFKDPPILVLLAVFARWGKQREPLMEGYPEYVDINKVRVFL